MGTPDYTALGRWLAHPPRCWYGKPRKTPIQGQTHFPCSCGLLDYLQTLPAGLLTDTDLARLRAVSPLPLDPDWMRRSR